MSTLDFLEKARAELLRNNVKEPYEITMPEVVYQSLKRELMKIDGPLSFSIRRRHMGRVAGFDVYVDDGAPPGYVAFGSRFKD